jgi:DNA mismatch endonuclease (patch repair protein)
MRRSRTVAEVSAQMRSIRKTNTKPELAVRRLAHAMGYRFRIHCRHLPGTPDLVFSSRKKIIFVHGCFWHRHEGCLLAKLPSARPEYWVPKFARNKRRDAVALTALEDLGWEVLVVWECELRDEDSLRTSLQQFLGSQTGIRVA